MIDTVRKITGPEATTRLEREPPSEKPVSHHIGDSEMRKSGSYGFQSSVKVVTWQFGKMTQPMSLEVQESLKLLRLPSDMSAFEEYLLIYFFFFVKQCHNFHDRSPFSKMLEERRYASCHFVQPRTFSFLLASAPRHN